MKKLDSLKLQILSSIKPEWNNLERIRYVYIKTCEYLCKNTDFFLTVEGKTNRGLSPKKLDKIFENLDKSEYKVICRSAALFLKEIYDALNIKSFLVKTSDYIEYDKMKNKIYHYFLCVNDGKYNYFLTPAADIAYIQNGLSTRHFATDISYLVTGPGGVKIPYYEANDEIPHRNLNSEELKKIDNKIGFTTLYNNSVNNPPKLKYIDEILMEEKNMYIDLLSKETDYYNKIFTDDDNKKMIKNPKEASIFDYLKIVELTCKTATDKLKDLLGIEIEYKNIMNRNELNEWFNLCISKFDKNKYNVKEILYANPMLMLSKAKSVCNLIFDLNENKIDFIKFRRMYIIRVTELSKHFVDSKYVIEPKDKDKYVTSGYINKRINTLLPYLFNANSNFKEKFNYLNASEQIEIMKFMIQMMFQDIPDKSFLKEGEIISSKIKPIFKRINLYTYRKINSDQYGSYIAITDSDNKDSAFWYKYDFKNNIFEETNLINILLEHKNGKYEILSHRLKTHLEDLETKGYSKK